LTLQGKYYEKGQAYYEQGRYQKALNEFERELGTWYSRLVYNEYEASTRAMLARTYCQFEDFDRACHIYALIAERYPGTYAQRAKYKLEIIQRRLQQLSQLEKWLADGGPEYQGLFDGLYEIYVELYGPMADGSPVFTEENKAWILNAVGWIYERDLDCYARAARVYKKILDMNVSGEWDKRAKANLERLPSSVHESNEHPVEMSSAKIGP